jgi:glycosyltransferase involved in cell wall biosynthesis
MRCPDVDELPAVPTGKSGWPWSGESAQSTLDQTALPRITVITPSFNQSEFIETTIRSVLLQGYPDLEYIIIDGGSDDGSVEIIRKYERWLSYWVSERDQGQSHAINKGLSKSTGKVLCWLNSDDYFLPGALNRVGELLAGGMNNYALVGKVKTIFHDGRTPIVSEGRFDSRRRLLEFWKGYHMHQPAIFWRREVFEKVGYLKQELSLTMDFDYWARISESFSFTNVDQVLACCHHHPAAKTSDDCLGYQQDLRRQMRSYWGSKWSLEYWRLESSALKHFVLKPLVQRLRL